MICVFICLTLLTLIAGLHLLAKVNKENLGSFFKWTSYFILVAATCVLICQIICCVKMCCMTGGKCQGMEQCVGGVSEGKSKCKKENAKCESRKMKCGNEKNCGSHKKCGGDEKCGDKKNCYDKMNCSGNDKCDHKGMSGDSTCCKMKNKSVEIETEKK